ncbi:hypothetical protein LRY64_03560 [Candidatus Woesebacteria bacterium]|nr:hypothetical protein [Candidatus Woesebacteria bacterium]
MSEGFLQDSHFKPIRDVVASVENSITSLEAVIESENGNAKLLEAIAHSFWQDLGNTLAAIEVANDYIEKYGERSPESATQKKAKIQKYLKAADAFIPLAKKVKQYNKGLADHIEMYETNRQKWQELADS